MKKLFLVIYLLLFPYQVLAYSNEIIIDPKPIGIEVHAKGIYIIDFYKVNGKLIAKNQGFQIGDRIIEVNNKETNNINDLEKVITKEGEYKVAVYRNNEIINLTLKTEKEENVIKTGLYVKDQINGVGTLSYIDPETKVFASLGHDIIENSSKESFSLQDGSIYQVFLSNIKKSSKEAIGQMSAEFTTEILGSIKVNKENGIYGIYEKKLSNENKVEIAKKEEIKKGKAYIRLNINNEIENYEISILSLDESSQNKNILFEITDEKLLSKTGGIIQGMSGSPILQNNKVIGIVNYVVVGTPEKGYGIFIEKMLEEGDKLIQ